MEDKKNTNSSCLAPSASKNRLRILISAYACEPNKGSEPGVGWNVTIEMAKLHDVWVLTRANNREVIEAALADHPVEGLHFFYHDLPKWFCWWKKGGRGVQLYYYLWQLSAISKVREKHEEIKFDLSHHVTFVKYWAPSCLAWLDVPFVWGPVGGGEVTPKPLMKTLDIKGRVYESVKLLAARMGEKDPFVIKTVRRAHSVFASTADTADRLQRMGAPRVEVLTQIGMNEYEIKDGLTIHSGCRFISIGRMIHWKGFLLGLKAFSKLQSSNVEYWFVGDGSCRAELEIFSSKQGLTDKVRFVGSLSRNEVMKKMTEADVLVHPSFHDSAGLVCLEAMASARPVICLNTGGPAELVDDQSGFLVSVDSEKSAIKGLATAMESLAADKALRVQMGEAAQLRIRNQFLWENKVETFSKLYLELVDDKATSS